MVCGALGGKTRGVPEPNGLGDGQLRLYRVPFVPQPWHLECHLLAGRRQRELQAEMDASQHTPGMPFYPQFTGHASPLPIRHHRWHWPAGHLHEKEQES